MGPGREQREAWFARSRESRFVTHSRLTAPARPLAQERLGIRRAIVEPLADSVEQLSSRGERADRGSPARAAAERPCGPRGRHRGQQRDEAERSARHRGSMPG